MSYQRSTVTAPASLPWDLERVAAGALDVLRLDPSDADAARILGHAQVATRRIDQYLDLECLPDEWLTIPVGMAVPPVPPDFYEIPPELYEAAINLTIERYRSKDAAFGVLDSWSADGSFTRISADTLKGVRSLIGPSKGRWGVA